MDEERDAGAPEFTFIQTEFEAKTGLTGTLENSAKVFIMVAKVLLKAIHNTVVCNSD